MGYGHSISMSRDMTIPEFEAVGRAACKIFNLSGIPLSGSIDCQKWQPVVTRETISVNGVGEGSRDDLRIYRRRMEHHFEPYYRTHRIGCTTQRLPYDAVVCAVLLAVKREMGRDAEIRSDGCLEDWVYGPADGTIGGAYVYWRTTGDSPVGLLDHHLDYRGRGRHYSASHRIGADMRRQMEGLHRELDDRKDAVLLGFTDLDSSEQRLAAA